ncbi:hypothetical protein NM688_g4533 [Phlebia brevispora]|uniref:Uncharacterized protein n=1 Tax=Phlebia brevispora TaxID=194682 RepID=A0ACC1T2D0_9APHY|nr:hypothetical protein NM688_g4533 [Phlebia brevispora]
MANSFASYMRLERAIILVGLSQGAVLANMPPGFASSGLLFIVAVVHRYRGTPVRDKNLADNELAHPQPVSTLLTLRLSNRERTPPLPRVAVHVETLSINTGVVRAKTPDEYTRCNEDYGRGSTTRICCLSCKLGVSARTNHRAMAGSFARFMRTERHIFFVLFALFTVIVLAMNATLSAVEMEAEPGATLDTFAIFNIVTCVLTFVTLIPVVIINHLRRGAIVSTILFELCWFGVLDVFWVAAAANTAHIFQGENRKACQEIQHIQGPEADKARLFCNTLQAGMAFSFLNFIILTFRVTALLVLVITQQQKDVRVWKSSVNAVAALHSPSSVDLLKSPQEQTKGDMMTA